MIDLIYLAFNRLEMTKASMTALLANTEWSLVRKFIVYDDGSTDGTREYLQSVKYPVAAEFVFKRLGGPVAIMNHYLNGKPTDLFSKIDNDVILPSLWLSECLKVMEAHKTLDLLGIEAFFPVLGGQAIRAVMPAKHIGGIGLMRRRCFRTLPKANGRFGFTDWQHANKNVVKGWLNPSLPVVLLDRMCIEPWLTLSRGYVVKKWQRNRQPYNTSESALWAWWKQ